MTALRFLVRASALVGLAAFGLVPGPARSQTCSYTPLVLGDAAITTGVPQVFSFTQVDPCWAVVGVMPNQVDDWDARGFQSPAGPPNCVTGLLAGSTAGGSKVDFVIGDFHHNPLGTYYFEASRWSGSFNAHVEWEEGGSIGVNNGVDDYSMFVNDVAQVCGVSLTAGVTYTFTFSPATLGSLTLLLFRNAGGGTYWQGRGAAEFEVTSTTTYTAPSTGDYGVVIVNDSGYGGDFHFGVGACTAPEALTSEVTTGTIHAENYHQFDQQARYWTAVGVRNTAGQDWDMDVWRTGSGGSYPTCFTNVLANSLGFPPTVDFVVGDFNFNNPGTYYVHSDLVGDPTTSNAAIEWDGGSHQLRLQSNCDQGRNLSSSDVLAVWDVYLVAGTTYGFSLDAHTFGGTPLSSPTLHLFRNTGGGTYWAGRAAAQFSVPASTGASYTAPSTGWYGVVAVNEAGDTGHFEPNFWTCSEPVTLAANTPTTLSPRYADFRFTPSLPYWMAVGVRGDPPAAPWYVDVYAQRNPSPGPCLAGNLASSHKEASRISVVAGNNVSGTKYAEVYDVCSDPASSNAYVDWDPSDGVLQVNGPLTVRTTGPNDFLRVWDVYLVAGTPYHISFNPVGASPRLLVFRNTTGGTFWASREQAALELTASTDYTPPASGYYGLVVVNDDGAAGQYGLGVGTCTAPSALTSGVVSSSSNAENYYTINQGVPYWTAVGVRGASDWDLEAYSAATGSGYATCFSGLLANSSLDWPATDFVVGDFNHNPFGTYYVRPHLFLDLGSGAGAVEWDSGTEQLNPGMPAAVRLTGPADVLECWDSWLEPSHAYQFAFTYGGSAALSLGVFRNTGGGVYWAGRSDAQILVNQTTTWVTPAGAPQFYGLVVVNENGMSGSYSLQVIDQGAVGVEPPSAPEVTELRGVRPNPARGAFQIQYALREPARVRFDVMDLAGRRIATLGERDQAAGIWTRPWDGGGGGGLRPGLYILRMIVNGRAIGQARMALLE